MQNQVHIPIIRTRLTKETSIQDIYEEVVEACNEYLPVKDGISFFSAFLLYGSKQFPAEWTGVVAFENMTTIVARVANRIFVGPVLCESQCLAAYWHSKLILSVNRQEPYLDQTLHRV